MSLAVLAFTRGDSYAWRFLEQFRDLAQELDAKFVIAGDGEAGRLMANQYSDVTITVQTSGIQESHLALVAKQIDADWLLKLDDDETLSPAMWAWLLKREWETGKSDVYSFPYAWLWGDDKHFITSAPFWPDPHARLMRTPLFYDWGTGMHAPNPHGTGVIVPVAHCHHKFLVKNLDERCEVAARYDGLRAGAGTGEHYGKFTLPEMFCHSLTVREVGDGTVKLDEWIGTGERVKW